MPQLIVSQNGSNYRVIPFTHTLSIGREKDNDFVLDSPQVSRHHGKVQQEDDQYYLIDSGSTNAIWVGNEKVSSIPLVNGMTFRIVDFFFTYVDEEQDLPARVFTGEEGTVEPNHQGHQEHKTILFGLESFIADKVDPDSAAFDLPKTGQFSLLLTIFHQLFGADEEPELLSVLLRSSIELVSADYGFVATRNPDGDLVYRATEQVDTKDAASFLCNDLINRAMESGVTAFGNCSSEEPASSKPRQGKPATLALCSPLFFEGQTEGCLYLAGIEPLIYSSGCSLQIELLLQYASSLLERLRYRVRINVEQQKLKSRLAARDETIIHSESMLRLYEDIKTISPINVPVLILGEAGTGKELIASALHSFSKRQGGYVTLNCSAIPEGLFESELFGSVKGAFHNAVDKPGKLEMAHNGTVFLDEIGDMALSLQPKLLRFLENREVIRLGDTRIKKLDVRVVAATNQDLDMMMQEKSFREDFYQRLSCFVLRVPPLRKRKEDIEPLTHYFLKRFAQEYGWPIPEVSDSALQALIDYSWPGNIRELKNTILRTSVQSRGKKITVEDLARISDMFGVGASQKFSPFPSLEEVEKKYIRKALKRTGWNISDAAKMVGVARSTFYQKMKKFHITAGE